MKTFKVCTCYFPPDGKFVTKHVVLGFKQNANYKTGAKSKYHFIEAEDIREAIKKAIQERKVELGIAA